MNKIRDNKFLGDIGMTLIELLITLVIVIVVLAAAFWSFAQLFQGFKSQTKVSESHISSLISIELLRKDIEMAGFGVPYNCTLSNSTGITFNEAVSTSSSSPPNPAAYNSVPSNVRPFELGNNVNHEGNSDYLVIRSAYNPGDEDTFKWAFFNDGNPCTNATLIFGNEAFSDKTSVIIEDGQDTSRKIESNSTNNWAFYYNKADGKLRNSDSNGCGLDLVSGHFYLVYAVRGGNKVIRTPFNRVDYYLHAPSSGMPARCAPGTYELYRGQLKHGDGTLNRQPIFDCVKDFQVAFRLENSWNATHLPSSALDQKEKIKEVRVFVLYQEGEREREAVSSGPITLGDSDTGTLSTFTPSGDDAHYNWKVKKISVKPMNLGR